MSKRSIAGKDFQYKTTIGDGNCFLHSLLLSVSEEYREYNERGDGRRMGKMADDFREEVVSLIRKDNASQEHQFLLGDIPLLWIASQDYNDVDFTSYDFLEERHNDRNTLEGIHKVLSTHRAYIQDTQIILFQVLLGINMIIQVGEFSNHSHSNLNYLQYCDRPVIFIWNDQNIHYTHLAYQGRDYLLPSETKILFSDQRPESQRISRDLTNCEAYVNLDTYLRRTFIEKFCSIEGFNSANVLKLWRATSEANKMKYNKTLSRLITLSHMADEYRLLGPQGTV